MPGSDDPLLQHVSFSLVPVAIIDQLFEVSRRFPRLQRVGQNGGIYYIVAVPRFLRSRWSGINRILEQREAIHDLGLLDNLYGYLPPGFSGIAISPDGSLYVYGRGYREGEVFMTGPWRGISLDAAHNALWRMNSRTMAEEEIPSGNGRIDALARLIFLLMPNFVQVPIRRAIGVAQRVMGLGNRAIGMGRRARAMMPGRPRLPALAWRRRR